MCCPTMPTVHPDGGPAGGGAPLATGLQAVQALAVERSLRDEADASLRQTYQCDRRTDAEVGATGPLLATASASLLHQLHYRRLRFSMRVVLLTVALVCRL